MSDYVKDNKTDDSVLQFNRKFVYIGDMLNEGKNVVNFYAGEKILFGRVSPTFIPQTIKTNILSPVTSNDPRTQHRVVNFVASAFEAMRLEFSNAAARGNIHSNHPYLSDLTVYRAYVDPKVLYQEYRDIYNVQLGARTALEGISKVKDFGEFIDNLMLVFKEVLPDMPITFPGFLKTSQCSTLSTGLAIEIADIDPRNDTQKMELLVDSANWEFFVNTCNDFGFMIDAYNPFRIVADINAPFMREIARRAGFRSFLLQGYESAPAYYIKRLVGELLRLYQASVPPEWTEYHHCVDGSIIHAPIVPQQYTVDQLVHQYPATYWMRIYMQMRLYEEKPNLSKNQHDEIIDLYLETMKARKSLSPISVGFENIINKPFDKSGSAGYIKKKRAAMANLDFDEGRSDNIVLTDLMDANDISNY